MPAVDSSRRFVGKWWLPGTATSPVGGVLDIAPDGGLRLELTDQLLPGGMDPVGAEVVHGHADGKQVTLLSCSPTNGGAITIAQVMTTTQVARVRVALIGVHLADANEELFDGLKVTITGLTPWAADSGIRTEFTGSPDTHDRIRTTVKYLDPLETTLTEPTPLTLGLVWEAKSSSALGAPSANLHSRTYRVKEHVALRLLSPRPQAWNRLNSSAVAMRDLMTIATQVPCRITGQTLLVAVEGPQEFREIELYYKSTSGWPDLEEKFYESQMIFTLAAVDFAAITQRWFELRSTIGLPLDVLLGLDYQPVGYYENRLFNAASAAEGFHAALCPDTTALPAEIHTALIKQVSTALSGLTKGLLKKVAGLIGKLPTHERQKVDALLVGVADPAQRNWVMNKMGSNHPGLMDRYRELASKADSEAVDALVTDPDVWAGWLRDARNAIGHLNTGKLVEKIPDEDARYYLAAVTRGLLHLVTLAELGITAENQRLLVATEWSYVARRFGIAVRNYKQSQS